MRLAVTGGRYYGNQARVTEALDAIHDENLVDTLIHGDCPDTPGKPRSLDQMAADWARSKGITVEPYPANWDDITTPPVRVKYRGRQRYNALAGFQRNVRMHVLGRPHLLASFNGPTSGPGTAHCRAQALLRGIAVMDVDA